MKTVFHCELENGIIIEDLFCFRQRIGKSVLFDIFKNWKDLISDSYGIKIKSATYGYDS